MPTPMRELFELTVSPAELFVRGTLVYIGLIVVLRFILRRDVGALGTADLLFIVLVADAAQNAMAGEYRSVSDGALLLGTLVFWNLALDWLAFHNRALRWFLEPPPLPLIQDGRILRRNLKREWITLEELEAKLREHGIESPRDVRLATLETDGELSVLRKDDAQADTPRKRHPGVT